MILHMRAQFCVGQGCFHGSQIIIPGNKVFTYVYDFGSVTRSSEMILTRAWNDFQDISFSKKIETIDNFFISHFDRDHVNGLRVLSQNGIKVKEFILPDYNARDKIVLLYYLSQSKISRQEKTDLSLLVINPEKWLKKSFKGADVIYVASSENENVYNDESNYGGNLGEKIIWEKQGTKNISNGKLTIRKNPEFAVLFFPYFYKKPISKDTFSDICEKKFGSTFEDIVAQANSKKRIDNILSELKKISSELFSNINVSSLCLSVSYKNNKSSEIKSFYTSSMSFLQSSCDLRCRYYRHNRYQENLGWLGTGDSDLLKKETRDIFFLKYKNIIKEIITFQMPHHGSKENFDVFNLEKLNYVENFIVSYGIKNKYKHPWKALEQIIYSFDKNYIKVTESSGAFVEMIKFFS